MNKAEIIAAVAQSTGMTQKAVGEVIKSLTETISDVVRQGEPVRLSGLLNISVTHRPARMVNVPSTGKKQESPAKNVVKIKPDMELSAAANASSSASK